MYPWHLQMVYCEVDILLKMVSCKGMTVANDYGVDVFLCISDLTDNKTQM